MSNTNRILKDLAKDTRKGELLQGLVSQHYGTDNYAAVNIGANITDRDTITVEAYDTDHPLDDGKPYRDTDTVTLAKASDIYELVVVVVDTGQDTSATILKHTIPDPVELTIGNSKTSEGGAGEVGTILRVDDEFLNVIEVTGRHSDNSPNRVLAERGFAGSTIASHNSVDINIQADTALTVKALPIPVKALTKAGIPGFIETAVNWYAGNNFKYNDKREVGLEGRQVPRFQPKVPVHATAAGGIAYLHYPATGGDDLVVLDASFTSTSNTITTAAATSTNKGAFFAGTQPLEQKVARFYYQANSDDASNGLHFVVPFKGTAYVEKSGAAVTSNVTTGNSEEGTAITIAAAGVTDADIFMITVFG